MRERMRRKHCYDNHHGHNSNVLEDQDSEHRASMWSVKLFSVSKQLRADCRRAYSHRHTNQHSAIDIEIRSSP